MSARFEGLNEIMQRITRYEQRIKQIVRQIAQFWQAKLEAYAKTNAPWTDQTANARQSLHAFIEELSGDTVRLYLSHGMDYGIYLETKYAGQYAIIWPTIQQHLEPIRRMLQDAFR
ncbi:MAG: hypothetical protein AAFN11_18245 [Chloroflexota bacterium]